MTIFCAINGHFIIIIIINAMCFLFFGWYFDKIRQELLGNCQYCSLHKSVQGRMG